jgi:hypothetical protein
LPCTQSPTHTSRIIPVPIQTVCTQASGGDGIGAAGRAEHLTDEYKDGSLRAAPQRRRRCWNLTGDATSRWSCAPICVTPSSSSSSSSSLSLSLSPPLFMVK